MGGFETRGWIGMSVRLFCPHCVAAVERSEQIAGEATVCERCGGTFVVPTSAMRPEAAHSAPPGAGSVTLADIEAARARAARLIVENVALQAELVRLKRHRQRVGTA